jgi:predicted Zn-dependent peptidase
VASGKLNFDQLVAAAERYCGSWTGRATERLTPRAPARSAYELLTRDLATQAYAVQLAAAPGAQDEDRYAARLLTTILGDDSGSRLFWELVDTGLAEYAAIGSYEYQGTGASMTYLSCAPEELEENLARLQALFTEAEQHGITAAELQQAQNKICAHLILKAERSSNRLFSVGGNWVQRGEYRTVAEVVAAYRRVTLADIHAVLERYPLTQATTVCVAPSNAAPGDAAPSNAADD